MEDEKLIAAVRNLLGVRLSRKRNEILGLDQC